MSKEGNMEELQRFWLGDDEYGDPALVPASDGEWVRFSDVEEREARFQARIEELKQALDLTESAAPREERLYGQVKDLEAHVARLTAGIQGIEWVTDARWRERIEGKARELDAMAQAQADEFGNYITSAGRSGDYKEGRADAYDDAADALRSLLDSGEEQKCPECGGSRSGLTPFFCGVCKGSGRATPSPALEGREEC